MADLEMNVSEIVNPVLSSFEQPELLFTTNDDEVEDCGWKSS